MNLEDPAIVEMHIGRAIESSSVNDTATLRFFLLERLEQLIEREQSSLVYSIRSSEYGDDGFDEEAARQIARNALTLKALHAATALLSSAPKDNFEIVTNVSDSVFKEALAEDLIEWWNQEDELELIALEALNTLK